MSATTSKHQVQAKDFLKNFFGELRDAKSFEHHHGELYRWQCICLDDGHSVNWASSLEDAEIIKKALDFYWLSHRGAA